MVAGSLGLSSHRTDAKAAAAKASDAKAADTNVAGLGGEGVPSPRRASMPAGMSAAVLAASAATGTSTECSSRRRLSFRSGTSARASGAEAGVLLEIDIWKEDEASMLGLVLAPPEDGAIAGALVASIDATSTLWLKKSGGLKAGDIIQFVNGTHVPNQSAALARLRATRGVVLLGVLRRPLPSGWRQSSVHGRDGIRIVYKNRKLRVRSFSHPHTRMERAVAAKEGEARARDDGPGGADELLEDEVSSDSEDEAHGVAPPTRRASFDQRTSSFAQRAPSLEALDELGTVQLADPASGAMPRGAALPSTPRTLDELTRSSSLLRSVAL